MKSIRLLFFCFVFFSAVSAQQVDSVFTENDSLNVEASDSLDITANQSEQSAVKISHAAVEDGAGFPAAFAAKIYDHGGDKLRFRFFKQVRRHDVFGQPGSGDRGNGVDFDIVFLAFKL